MKSHIKVFLLGAILTLSCSISAFAQLGNWAYKVPIDITENRGESGTDYVLYVDINTQQYVLNGQMLSSGNDMRFATSCTGTETIPFWIESGMNTTTTRVWLRLPQLTPNSTNEVYLYMGNPSASNASSQAAVFPNSFVSSGNFTMNVGTYAYDWFQIDAGDTLTLIGNNSDIFQLTAAKIIINGVIDGNGAGYEGGAAGSDGSGPGGGGTSVVTSGSLISGAGGGAYGGDGGDGGIGPGETPGAGGLSYGSSSGLTIFPGSGGGGTDAGSGAAGGNGGAGIYLKSFQLVSTSGGYIYANGEDGAVGTTRHSGGGSGGGILLESEYVSLSYLQLNVNGGDGGSGSGSDDGGGGGGGGRAKLYRYNTSAFFIGTNNGGGNGGCCGDSISATNGGGGSNSGTVSAKPGQFDFSIGSVSGAPIASVSSGADSVCAGDTETYQANAVTGGSYAWSLSGGGTITNGQFSSAVEVNWTTAGAHNLFLDITDSTGCSIADTFTVTVGANPTAGTINASASCAGGGTDFTVTGTSFNPAFTYAWDFGDTATSNQFQPSHTYAAAGTYTVSLTITNGFGCSTTSTQSVTVDAAPVAGYTFSSPTCPGGSVSFTNTSTGAASYLWDFGDGTTSTTASLSHNYAAAGTYTVTLTATSTAGCTDVASASVTISPAPVADFDFVSACPGSGVSFTDQSTASSGTITGWFWDLGDGNTSLSQNPSHTYAAAGTYSVMLTATTADGCSDNITKSVTVFDAPVAGFTATTECQGNATSFTNTSNIPTGTLSYSWAFGDGNSSTDINPTHTYLASGTYNVTLTATSNNGCTHDTIITVTVNDQPTADFTIVDNEVCDGDLVSFTNFSVVAANGKYTWDFGDGNTSLMLTPTHTYAGPGVYTVTLTAEDTVTGCSAVATGTVTVFDEPVADFTAGTVCQGTATQFVNNSSIGTGTLNFIWNFDDGTTSTDPNPSHTYLASGSYDVTLTATSNTGCNDSSVVTVTVDVEPTAAFTIVDASVCDGDSVYFTNGSSSATDQVYTWDFGDGNTTTDTDPTYLYGAPGTYSVFLAVTDSVTGCTDTAFATVTIFDEPVAAFSATTVCNGTATQFTNGSTIGTGTLSYAWDFADGNSSTDINPLHTYAAAGTYDVVLLVTSNNGCTDSDTVTVTVNAQPISSFTVANSQVCQGDTMFFSSTSTVSGTDILYTWDFGDGGTSDTTDVGYLYAAAGTYDVFLAVTDTLSGCTDTSWTTVTVFYEPTAGFTATTVCQGDATQFTNTSNIGVGTLSYSWNFDDGTSSTDINPTHTYAAAGTYNVILIVTSDNGCTDGFSIPVTVNPEPVSDFSAVDATLCDGDVFEFTNSSTYAGSTIMFTWNFGDGTTSNDTSTTHLYSGPGIYTVWLAVTDTATGCTDTSSISVEVYHEPVAGWTANDACINTSVAFTNTTTLGVGTLSYSWDFGDGNGSTDINPTHTYDTAGIMTITLAVVTDNGCTDTFSNTIVIYPKPVADFSAGAACFGFATDFTNLTTIAFGTSTYSWDFGDGVTDTATNPSHTYVSLGIYTVTLTATSNAGCTDSYSATVQVNPNPSANFSATTVCQGDVTEFTNTSSVPSGSYTSFWDFGDGFTSSDDEPGYTYAAAGDYTVMLVVTSDLGCTDTATKTVTVIPTPQADFIADPVCFGEAVVFNNVSSVPSGGGSIADVKWLLGDGSVSFEATPSHMYSAPGSYLASLIVTSTSGCVDTISKAVVVHELPDTTIRPFGPTEFCPGDSVELSAASGYASYLWSTGETTQNIIVRETGTYCVTVTTAFGCVGDSCIDVVKFDPPIADAGNDTTISKGYLAILHGSGGVGYEWSPAATLYDQYAATTSARPLEDTEFQLIVTDTNGCKDTAFVTVFVLEDYLVEATNLITPNNDGKNDRFNIINIGTYPDVEVLIFDRWGTKVYESKAYDNSWDGTKDGYELPEGTYYYVIRFDGSERTYKGAINILR